MSNQNVGHASFVLRKVVGYMVKSGSVKERLLDGLLKGQFLTVRTNDLPVPHDTGFANILKELTTVEGYGMEASFIATVNAMTDEQAEKMAERIVNLTCQVSTQAGIEEQKAAEAQAKAAKEAKEAEAAHLAEMAERAKKARAEKEVQSAPKAPDAS